MKFDNPYIRLKYKLLAYKDSPAKKVSTMSELIQHCSKKTDICYKRFDFLSNALQQRFSVDPIELATSGGDMSMSDFISTAYVRDLCEDEDFMNQWVSYEYYTMNHRVAKRQNY